METSTEIAEILLEPKTRQILDTTICNEHLRFGCIRCATFCCKLGGPKITKKDTQRIENAGYDAEEFVDFFKDKSNHSSLYPGCLKTKQDGSCVFLKFNSEKGNYECSVYNSRPAQCRLFPFDFQKTDSKSIVLNFIPCCRGLNNPDGELVNESFIANYLLDAIFDLTF
ncbi:MAG: YkgJ family cysteine cluster protein [Candidatus Bathyarchaeia archaeon]